MLRQDQAKGTDTVPAPVSAEQKATAEPSNPDSAILADFNARLDNYVKKQRALLKGSPIAEDATPEQIKVRQDTIAAELRSIRKTAKQGDIFGPEAQPVIKRLHDEIARAIARGSPSMTRSERERSVTGRAAGGR